MSLGGRRAAPPGSVERTSPTCLPTAPLSQKEKVRPLPPPSPSRAIAAADPAPAPSQKEKRRREEEDEEEEVAPKKSKSSAGGGSERKRARGGGEDDEGRATKEADKETARKQLDVKMTESGARDIDPNRELKEQAVEAILVRWPYAGILWEYGIGKGGAEAPPGFLPMRGFPGVSVGVEGDVLGMLQVRFELALLLRFCPPLTRAPAPPQDSRPSAPRPSYSYLIALPTSTLKDMWKKAIAGQSAALIAADGPSAPLLRALKDEARTADKLDAEKADRHWARHLERGGGFGTGTGSVLSAAKDRLTGSATASSSGGGAGAAAPAEKAEKKEKKERKERDEKEEKKEKAAPSPAPAAARKPAPAPMAAPPPTVKKASGIIIDDDE